MSAEEDLKQVKKRNWFYEFELPDGTRTVSDMGPAVSPIHSARRNQLLSVISKYVETPSTKTAIDFASHEGYYSFELGKHFKSVTGLEIRRDSLEAAQLMGSALQVDNVKFRHADLQTLTPSTDLEADFVLVYGLLYHLENPVHTIRLASQLCKKHILIETQVFMYDISGKIEDGHYIWQRDVQGIFAIATDYSQHREGGSTDIALIPSLNGLISLLKIFGFTEIKVLDEFNDEYEQFKRGSRVMVYAAK